MQLYCHCDECQASSGSPYVARAVYAHGLVTRAAGGRVVGCNASLFPPGLFHPRAHVQCKSAVTPLRDDLPHYREWPHGVGGSGEPIDW